MHIAALARRLSRMIDLPTAADLAELGGEHHHIRVDRATASISVLVADLGCPDDEDDDDVREQLYSAAETLAAEVAAGLGLAPAGEFAADELAGYASRIRLRAGHWAVTVTGGQFDADLPLLVEVDFTYGADLRGRLTQLVTPRDHAAPVDWSSVGVDLPADYRWLMENYDPAVFGDHLTLTPPAALPAPAPGPTVGLLRYLTPPTLPVATMVDGSSVAYVLHPDEPSSRWSLRITGPGDQSWDLPRNILYLLTILLTDARSRITGPN